jgi:hypothetical protein
MIEVLPFVLLAVFLVMAGIGSSGQNLLPGDSMIFWYERAYYLGMFGIFASSAWIFIAAVIWWRRQDNLEGKE